MKSKLLAIFLVSSHSVLGWLPSYKKTSVQPLAANEKRRELLQKLVAATASIALPSSSVAAPTRAVGSGEIECRKAGNCLEIGELDGAVGWSWGGKDRCDPSDPLCGPDGKMRDKLVGKPVPDPGDRDITLVVAIQIEIGRGEVGLLRLGFYGKEAPGSVEELLRFLTEPGFETKPQNANSMGTLSVPVSLQRGGVVSSITPGLAVDFGVPSQLYAYARSRGVAKVDGFVPQDRPDPTFVAEDEPGLSHSVAGLVSVPRKGLGYGGTGFEDADDAFEETFLITAGSATSLDKTRRVVGQVLDASSMAFLERLATLATKRGIRGVIPGQTSGPPLLKVAVRAVEVSTVAPRKTG